MKRWILKEETFRFLEQYNLNAVNVVKDLDAFFNEGKQELACVKVGGFKRFSNIQVNLFRDECCEQIEVDDLKPDEIKIVPASLSIWQRIKRFLGV